MFRDLMLLYLDSHSLNRSPPPRQRSEYASEDGYMVKIMFLVTKHYKSSTKHEFNISDNIWSLHRRCHVRSGARYFWGKFLKLFENTGNDFNNEANADTSDTDSSLRSESRRN